MLVRSMGKGVELGKGMKINKEKNTKVKVVSKTPMNGPHHDREDGGSQLKIKIKRENPIFAMFDRRRKKSDTSGTEERERKEEVHLRAERKREVIQLGRLQPLSSVEKDQEID